MTMTGTKQELRSALQSRIEENDRIVAQFKVGEEATGRKDGVVVDPEMATTFRKNLDEAREIKSLLDGVSEAGEIGAWLAEPEGSGSAAMRAGAAAAAPGVPALPVEMKTLGERFTGSEVFQEFKGSGGYTMRNDWEIKGADLAAVPGLETKDVYTGGIAGTTTRGFGTLQRDPLVPRQFRRVRVRDLFPATTTTANLIDFFRVLGYTNNASVVPERASGAFGLKPQTSLAFSPGQAPVRTIAHFEVAHRNVIADEPQLQAIINNELLYGLRLHEDYQILQGTGTGEDLLGVLNTPGIQTTIGTAGVAGDNKADYIRRAATLALLAYYEPTGIVVHPYDWEDIELTKDTTGQYVITGTVAVGAQQTLWRQPVVDTPAMPEGRFLTGAFGLAAQLYDREVGNIRIAEQHADFFIRNAVVILAEERLALAVKRPEAFVAGDYV